VYGYANNSIDGHRRTYWSDDGLRMGTNQSTPPAGPEPNCTANRVCTAPGSMAYNYPFCATYPFWLRVMLAAPTSIQTVQLIIDQDMTYDVQTGNSASGPWTTQLTRPCTLCTPGTWTVTNPVQTHRFNAPVTTQFIQIAIKYSGAAGPGACGGCTCKGQPNAACTLPDFCSWCAPSRAPACLSGAAAGRRARADANAPACRATNIYELGAFSPNSALWPAPPPPALSPPPFPACPASPLVSQSFLGNGSDANGYFMRGSASLYNLLDPLVQGRGMLLTSLGATYQEGTVELKQNASWKTTCACGTQGGGAVVTANFTSGAGSVAGDGVLLALVDSTRQVPGSTAYLYTTNTTCGLGAVRPLYALILEFTTRDTTTCAGGSTVDLRLVRTYGPTDAPVELVHTRQPASGASCEPSCTLAPYMYSGAWWEAQIFLPTYVPSVAPDYEDMRQEIAVYTDGTLRMTLPDNSYVPSSFYVVAGGRNSDGANDRNGVANVHVDCVGNTAWSPDNNVAHQYYPSAAGAGAAPRTMLLVAVLLALSTLL